MKKKYLSPDFEFLEVEITDCLSTSLSENPMPDIDEDGDDFDWGFDW